MGFVRSFVRSFCPDFGDSFSRVHKTNEKEEEEEEEETTLVVSSILKSSKASSRDDVGWEPPPPPRSLSRAHVLPNTGVRIPSPPVGTERASGGAATMREKEEGRTPKRFLRRRDGSKRGESF